MWQTAQGVTALALAGTASSLYGPMALELGGAAALSGGAYAANVARAGWAGAAGVAKDFWQLGAIGGYYANANGLNNLGTFLTETVLGWDTVAPSAAVNLPAKQMAGTLSSGSRGHYPGWVKHQSGSTTLEFLTLGVVRGEAEGTGLKYRPVTLSPSQRIGWGILDRAVVGGNVEGVAQIGVPASRASNPLSPIQEYDIFGNEILYRTMKESHYRTLVRDNILTGTGETSLAPLEAFSANYDGALVRLTVKPGTSAKLQEIGIAANEPAAAQFPEMSTKTGPWNQTNARFKVEATGDMSINNGVGIMNTQIGKGAALNIFNSNLLDFERLN
ncbi:hypothetical protein HNQ59_003948 [Chitinivorax tropicus]|uniref:Uncharacterized protein n=1 Tax=Chitinivorax tropicus TaxID=714531 RepID=A0A840MW72_9PROT|nr:hypothetical protein [Chitinivorax tropicus]MBB5020623.1 hypothetical protein [Chitinivorax tropicus]